MSSNTALGHARTWIYPALVAATVLGRVAAQPSVPDTIDVTGRAGSYSLSGPVGASKTDTPLSETPMSIQIVTRDLMDDQQVVGIKDGIQNVSGVQSAEYEWYDFVQIRGFANGYAANYRNGLQLQAITGLETALVERMEVVKGPASMLYGRIEPGGLVNLVTLAPQAEPGLKLQQQAGSFDFLRTTLDATGPIGGARNAQYRLVGAFSKSDSFMDFVQKRNAVGAAYFAFQPTERFSLNVDIERQRNRFMDTEDQGIPIIGERAAPVPQNAYYGDTVNWEIPNRQDRTLVALDWSYELNDRWRLTHRLHRDDRDEQQLTIWFGGFDGVATMDRGLWFVHPERETVATNLDLVGDVEIGTRRHRFLLGLDWFRFTSDWVGFSSFTPEIPSIDIFNPTYGVSAAALQALDYNFFYRDHDEWHGFYVQDQISLTDRWELLIGARADNASAGNGFDDTSLSAAYAALELRDDDEVSPRVGVLYKLSDKTSLYASYSESFGNNNGRSTTGIKFDPQSGEQLEFGAKMQWFDGRVNASVALFQLDKTNILTADLSTPDPDDQVPIGEVRSEGVELDVAGQVTQQLSLIASYTYDDATITRDRGGREGNRHPNVPLHTASLWLKHDTAPGSATGWELGGGVYLRDDRAGNPDNTWVLPGYGRVDALFGYRNRVGTRDLSVQLNVQNLLDREYVDRGGSGGSVAKYGAPRTFIGSVRVDF